MKELTDLLDGLIKNGHARGVVIVIVIAVVLVAFWKILPVYFKFIIDIVEARRKEREAMLDIIRVELESSRRSQEKQFELNERSTKSIEAAVTHLSEQSARIASMDHRIEAAHAKLAEDLKEIKGCMRGLA